MIDTSAEFDQHNELTSAYIVCATPRTGSNLLCFTLAKQGLGLPLEYLNLIKHETMQDFLLRMFQQPSNKQIKINSLAQLKRLREAYLPKLMEARTTSNGTFGIKVFPNHLLNLFPEQSPLVGLANLIPTPVNYIHIWRTDICRMTVSSIFAQKQQQWHSKMTNNDSKAQRPVPYDFNDFMNHLVMLHQLQLNRRTLFKQTPSTQILSINYTTLTTDFTNTIQHVNNFLSFPNLEVPEAPIQKQTSPEKTAMVERFKAECMEKEPWVFDVDYRLNTEGTDQPQ